MLTLLLAFYLVVVHAEVKVENDVVHLTTPDFDNYINEHDYVLVEFYAPWCGHCKALKPEYEEAAGKLKSELPDVVMAAVDATVETDLAQRFDVKGYPTMKFFKKGKWIDYKSGHKSADLMKWIKAKIGPSVKSIEHAADLEAFTKSDDIVVVGFIKANDEAMSKILEEVAETMDNIPFAIASSEELFTKHGITKNSLIRVYKKFDEGSADYAGEHNAEEIGKFVQVESIPLITDFSQETAGSVFGSHIRLHFIAFARKSTDYDKLKADLAPVAKKYKGTAHFIMIDIDVKDHLNILNFFGMSEDDLPAYRFVNLSEDMVKYKPDSTDFSEQAVIKFVDEVTQGKRKPFLMSQEIPPASDEPVRVLVGLNYHDVTKDTSKSVFVKIYAPWCGHCKALAPIWDQLGDTYKGRSDIIIAKMDATANEAEGLRVGSFPTLKFYPKGSSEAIDYSGERTLDALKSFVDSDGKVTKKSEENTDDTESKDEL